MTSFLLRSDYQTQELDKNNTQYVIACYTTGITGKLNNLTVIY